VARGYLGIYPQDLTPDLAQQFNIPNQTGALVGDVYPSTPAQKAGLKSGDVILAINDKDITDAHSLTLTVSELAPGSTATLKILRDGTPKSITLVLAEHPGSDGVESQKNPESDSSTMDSLDGVAVQDLDSDIRQQLRIPDHVKGAIVTEVAEDSNAAEADLMKGDVIVEINRQPVASADDAIRLSKEAKGDHILLKVWHREGGLALTRFLSVDNTKRSK
jgi:serine protease Do